jgi:hypothetical protein
MTYSRFLELFPDNAACLEYLKERFFADGTECPKCSKESKFHRIKGRSAYSCQFCGHHVYPTAGTIFHKSTVSLQLWFYAVYLMSSTRCGISAKQLEREIGVTYKTAHRMFKQIRTLLADDDDGPLDGNVEVDESAYGGRARANESRQQVLAKKSNRPTIIAMVERGGRVRPLVAPDRGGRTINHVVREHVLPPSMLFTDEYQAYDAIGKDYKATVGSNIRRTSTPSGRPTLRRLRDSSACSRTESAASTTPSAPTTYRPTLTSTRSDTTGAIRRSRCSGRSSTAWRRQPQLLPSAIGGHLRKVAHEVGLGVLRVLLHVLPGRRRLRLLRALSRGAHFSEPKNL